MHEKFSYYYVWNFTSSLIQHIEIILCAHALTLMVAGVKEYTTNTGNFRGNKHRGNEDFT